MSHVSLLCFYAYRLYLTRDMDKSSLRHIHDPVLLSLNVEVICYINFLACYINFFGVLSFVFRLLLLLNGISICIRDTSSTKHHNTILY